MPILTNVSAARPVATLWRLAWNNDQLSCVVYRNAAGLQLRVESSATLILAEPFDVQPRAVARSQALRRSLKRRGWRDSPVGSGSSRPTEL